MLNVGNRGGLLKALLKLISGPPVTELAPRLRIKHPRKEHSSCVIPQSNTGFMDIVSKEHQLLRLPPVQSQCIRSQTVINVFSIAKTVSINKKFVEVLVFKYTVGFQDSCDVHWIQTHCVLEKLSQVIIHLNHRVCIIHQGRILSISIDINPAAVKVSQNGLTTLWRGNILRRAGRYLSLRVQVICMSGLGLCNRRHAYPNCALQGMRIQKLVIR